MFKSTLNKGFQITLDNGITVSVQFGKGNYCERREIGSYEESSETTACKDAEVAAWNSGRVWYKLGQCDTVNGWQNVNQVLQLIDFMRSLTGDENPEEVEIPTFEA